MTTNETQSLAKKKMREFRFCLMKRKRERERERKGEKKSESVEHSRPKGKFKRHINSIL
jgi:hypothetical protein